MKKYDNYKDSGVEWIGEIPSHWDITRIGINSELTVPQRDKPKDLDGPIPWLRIEDFDGKYVSSSKTNQGVTQETVDSMNLKVYPVGTVLTACSCAMGMTAIVEKPLITNQTFIGITPKDNLNSVYLYYFFKASTQYLNSISTGAIQSYLSRSEFSKLRIPKISLNEQIQIANYLDHKTSQIDHLIAKKEQFIKLLEEERVAVINQAVTKGLDPNVPMKDSGVEWLGEIPEHWEVKRLKYCLKIQSGKGITNDELNPFGKFAVYGGNGIMGYTDKYSSEGIDLIIGRVGALCGNVHLIIGEKWISDNALYANTEENEYFIEYFLRFLDLNRLANKNAQPLITGTMVKEQFICLPTIEEQLKIVNYIKNQHNRIDTLLNKTKQEIDLIKEYKTALISEVVTGKVDVSTSSTQV